MHFYGGGMPDLIFSLNKLTTNRAFWVSHANIYRENNFGVAEKLLLLTDHSFQKQG